MKAPCRLLRDLLQKKMLVLTAVVALANPLTAAAQIITSHASNDSIYNEIPVPAIAPPPG